MTAEKQLNEKHAPSEVWVTHHALDISEPEHQWLNGVNLTPWDGDYDAPITKWAAQTRYIRADLAAVQPAQVRVKPLEWTTRSGAPTAFGTYIVTCEDHDSVTVWFVLFNGKPLARCGEHRTEDAAKAAAQADYDARILAALEPQPDPRDEVIARLVDAATHLCDGIATMLPPLGQSDRVLSLRAALAAAKAVQK